MRLNFTHQLAKVRVVLGGTQAAQVSQVEVYSYTQCFNDQGLWAIYTEHRGWIKMRQVDATTWEANVISGLGIDPANFIRLNGSAVAQVTGLTLLEAGQMYTVNLTVGEPVLQDGATLTEPGTYVMQGTYTQGITIQGDGITVVMDGATVSTSGIGINVQGDDATIQVSGADNTVSSSGSAGIHVALGKTLTIKGDSREEDALAVTAGGDAAGIGGYDDHAAGNIVIEQVTVRATASAFLRYLSPGIGGVGTTCGDITITDAIVHAYGAASYDATAPAIGAGLDRSYDTCIPDIAISGSTIYAYRGNGSALSVRSWADYIGCGGYNNTGAYQGANMIQCGAGGITGSTVYCYTGDTLDKTVVYDASGNATER